MCHSCSRVKFASALSHLGSLSSVPPADFPHGGQTQMHQSRVADVYTCNKQMGAPAPEKVEKSSSERAERKRRCASLGRKMGICFYVAAISPNETKMEVALCMCAPLANVRVIELPAVIKSGESLAFIRCRAQIRINRARGRRWRAFGFSRPNFNYVWPRCCDAGPEISALAACTPAAAIYHKISRFQSKISRFSLSALLVRQVRARLPAYVLARRWAEIAARRK